MAFWAECVRRNWYCVNGFDAVLWYSRKLYQEWRASLTLEQIERAKRRDAERQMRYARALMVYANVADHMIARSSSLY